MGLFASKSIPKDKKIVIVGGGYGGTELGVDLLKQGSDFTIIDVTDSFYHNVGAVRASSEQGFVNKLFIPYSNIFGEHFKQGRVVDIKPAEQKVVLEDQSEIAYDVLVISTGSTSLLPYKKDPAHSSSEYIVQLCSDKYKQVKDSKEFVVIGGGAVGCEIAGELATDYKNSTVTLIHSHDVLVHESLRNVGRYQTQLKSKLTKKGIKLVLGESVVEGLQNEGIYGPSEITTDKGNKFHGDTVFRCTGAKVNSQAYSKALASATNPNGSLQVNEFLQVKGYDNIFAIGDCTDVPEMKLAYRAKLHVDVIKQNLKAYCNGGKLQSYNPEAAMFAGAISIGRADSIGVAGNGYLIPSFLLNSAKSNDLMVAQKYKELNQTPP